MCHLIISPTCTAGNLSSKQSAVTLWFSEYWGLSENWAEEYDRALWLCKFFCFFFPNKNIIFSWEVLTEFVLLDFLVHLINCFNNSNHHKHSIFFWVRWCSLSYLNTAATPFSDVKKNCFLPFVWENVNRKMYSRLFTYTDAHIHIHAYSLSHAFTYTCIAKSVKSLRQKEESRQFLPW